MINEAGNWTDYRARFDLTKDDQVDLHFGERFDGSYQEAMSDVEDIVRRALAAAQKNSRPYVMFIHGWSTSRSGATTARSVVRSFMRSKEATPFIDRSKSIQHPTVFVAKIKGRS